MEANKSRAARYVNRALLQAFCILFFVICMLPIWLLLVNTTRSTGEIQTSVSFLPGTKLIENWRMLDTILRDGAMSLARAYLNSGIVSGCVVVLSVGFSALFAFVFTVYSFPFKNALFAFVLFIIMVPSQLGIIGFYKQMVQFNLLDTFVPLTIPTIVSASTIFFLTQYYRIGLPKDIVEAARIDGAGELRIFFRIAVPIGVPALATMAIAVFIESWNAYNIPNIMLTEKSVKTLPLVIASIKAMGMNKEYMAYGAVYLSVILSILPLIVVFLLFSKKIVGGVALGGVKE